MVVGAGLLRRAVFARHAAIVVSFALIVCWGATALQSAEPQKPRAFHASVINGDLLGSAYMIDHGLAVTNAHVVAGREIGGQVVVVTASGQRLPARIKALSTRMDLAVLSVARNLGTIARPAPRGIRRGIEVSAVGIIASSGNPTHRFTIRGTVSSRVHTQAPFGRGFVVRMPQVAKGFSGGPVFNADGQVIGMIAALRSAHASPSGQREAFVLSDTAIRREISQMIGH